MLLVTCRADQEIGAGTTAFSSDAPHRPPNHRVDNERTLSKEYLRIVPLVRRRITDAGSLKALAHPLRLALLEMLVTEGPQTASQAAVALDDSPSNCSWHLRKLAEHGFVRAAGGNGRNRPWRAVSEGLAWGDDTAEVESSAAGAGLADLLLERELQRYRAARSQQSLEPAPWREATGLHQSQQWMTAEEAQQVTDQVSALFVARAGRLQDPAQRPAGARLVSMVSWLVPAGPPRGRDL